MPPAKDSAAPRDRQSAKDARVRDFARVGVCSNRAMNRPGYGKTWWGEQWLQALAHIDFDNRLPRGRSYANKGAVRDLVVAGGSIEARVQGSRPRPYEVTISVPPLAARESARLLDRLAADPPLIARLLNRELDPAVLEAARSLGIHVFPERRSDLRMQCSCPDWAVPCKHLAAVIYLLSREIDGKPFLVFSLRGLDLAAALRKRDIHIEPEAGAQLPAWADLLADGPAPPRDGGDPAALERLDFSALPDLADPLWRVLGANPTFFAAGDFREIGRRVMARVAKSARQALDAVPTDADDDFDPQDRPTLTFDAAGVASLSGMSSKTAAKAGFAGLAERLQGVAAQRLPDLQPQLAALHALRLLALHLLAKGAVVPQIHAGDGRSVGLRWLPATLDAGVRDLLQRVAEALPAGMVVLQAGPARRKPGVKAKGIGAAAQATLLCSLFLDHYIRTWSEPAREKPAGNKTLALFFATGTDSFDGPGEAAIPGSIQTWLSRLHLARHEHAPLLCLDESDAGAFALTLAVERGAGSTEPPVALAAVLSEKRWAKARYAVLQQVSLLAEFFPPLAGHVRSGAAEPLMLASAELSGFLLDTLPALRLLGVRALLPKALERLLRPRLSLQVKGSAGGTPSFLTAGDVFAFDWKVAIGDQLVSREQFERLVRNATGIVRFKGEYVYLDPLEIEHLRAQLDKPPRLDAAELMRVALAGEYGGAAVGLDARAQRIVRQLVEAGDVPRAAGLRATLRPYQQRGYAWLYRNARIGMGSVIADDMGLGKTVQVIAALQKLKEEGALADAGALVVMPTSLLTNWHKELTRFAPELKVGIFHGTRRELTAQCPEVLLTTYGVARSEAAKLKAVPWRLVIADEAQNIKNPAAAQTKAIKSLPAASFIAMSGTPVENRLSEYWSIMDFANRGYLGSLAHFVKEYAVPIQTHRDPNAVRSFKRVTAPFLLRRLKSDKSIISDLPDKIEQDQYCALTPAQTALYESVVQEGLASLDGVSSTFKRQGLVLQMILALKQVCNHPAQYLKQGPRDAGLSGKAERFIELVDEIHAAHEKVLVFTQFREMGELLCAWLDQRHGHRPLFLHGGVARAQRDAMVERFQNDRTERVFILSLKAGGTGLNLTAASNVIHFDLWWNPAVEAQATDRAYRIGQQRNVQVHRFITRATFEERINEMMRAKRELADLTVGSGEQWIGNLPVDELRELFALG